MRKLIESMLFITITLLIGCKDKSVYLADKNKKLTSGIIKENMDLSVAPGDNFMSYANGNWINTANGTSLSPPQALGRKMQNISKTIIKRAASNQTVRNVDEQKLGNLYNSYVNLDLREQVGLKPLMDEFLRIDAIETQQELVSYFAYANRYAYQMPLNIGITTVDDKYELLLKNGRLKSSISVYLNNDSISQKSRDSYFKHIKRMFTAVEQP